VENSVATNSFGSNWFVGANAGVNLYNGVVTNGESPFKHISPALNIYEGKWHTPGFGWRVGYNGLNIQTYEDLDHAMFMNFHADMMFNLSNLIYGYREDRIWNLIPYLGVGWAGHKKYDLIGGDENISGSISANYGIMNTFRVAKRWALNLELSGFFFRNGFSGIAGRSGHDMMWAATVGVTYRIGKVGWDKTVDLPALQSSYNAIIDGLQNDVNNANALNQQAQKEIANLKGQLGDMTNKYNQAKNDKKIVDVKQSVFFAFGSSKINSKKEEMNIASYAKAAADAGVKLRVIGWADVIGSDAYNQKLSLQRAEAVAELLRANGATVESVLGNGETSEYSTKFLNRRAIIEVVK
jgi:outer membrane protein OmpA-like peptidoglycan-associated protein